MSGGTGFFLALEGVEGAGKSTQAALLAEALRERGRVVTLAREPGGTLLGERVRETVLRDKTVRVPAESELFLMLAARAAFVQEVVRPALTRCEVVVADRFELSTFAYQAGGRGLPLEEVRRCNQLATGGLSPDATLLLELSVEEGASRRHLAGEAVDRMESAGKSFHRRVADSYRELAAQLSSLVLVDARGSRQEVHGRVLEGLQARFPELFGVSGVSSEID
ncbi:MAG: dTMP kinase [Longimicrobiaceae bacterium]